MGGSMMRFNGRPTDSESYILKRHRLRIAREVIAEGGNLTDFADRIGVSRPMVTKYLMKHSPCTHQALKDNARYNAMHPIRVLERLRVIEQCRTRAQAARRLCMSTSGVTLFVKRYAPDGVKDALDDYEETYGAPLLEEAA